MRVAVTYDGAHYCAFYWSVDKRMMFKTLGLVLAFILSFPANARPHDFSSTAYSPEERTIAQLQDDLRANRTTSEKLVHAYVKRIETLDRAGPRLRAIIAVNPDALAQARALDQERRIRGARGPLHGIPIVLKDNIESADPMPTTAGSLALKDNVTLRDSPVVAQLRAAGAIILGKANLSEWANFRSEHSINGWSAVGGLTRNPYVLDRTPCGSSSGSAVAVAANLAAAAIGTETDGSITCPASMNAIVGLKPTLGLLSQRFIVPVAHSQDTAGPMGRTVSDVAILLNAMLAGREDYLAMLKSDALNGKRIGILALQPGRNYELAMLYEAAKQNLRAAGATLIDVQLQGGAQVYSAETVVLTSQFKQDLNEYLSEAAPAVKTRSLTELIEFNAKTPAEHELFGEELFVKSEHGAGRETPNYRAALELGKQWARDNLQLLLTQHHLDALVGPTSKAAWRIDVVNGDHASGGFSALPAVSGYPHLSVPMGFIRELPVGLSFVGPPNTEPALLGMGYAYELRSRERHPPRFIRSVDDPDQKHAKR